MKRREAGMHGSHSVPSSRVARLHRLAMMAGGIASNVAGDALAGLAKGQRPKLDQLLLTGRNAEALANDLARMRGAALKVGQLLSMETGDILPPELAQVLSRLQKSATPMPPRQLKSVLRENWGPDWRRHFLQFDTRPIAAASIGQVHRARLRDGSDLAIKVQYPGIARSIDSDVANLGALIRVSGLLPRDFALTPYLEEASRQLHLEADYEHEAAELESYADRLAAQERFELPAVARDWSTRQVLAMSFMPSRPIECLAEAPQSERDRVMNQLVDLFLREVFDFGVVQTDPNFANFRWNPTSGKLVLLDFGATRAFGDQLVGQCRALLAAGLAGEQARVEELATEISILTTQTSQTYRTAVLNIINMVFAEMRRDMLDFGASDLLPRVRAAGLTLSASRESPPAIPVDLLYLQRKVGGLYLLGAKLRARVPVRSLVEGYISQH